jgi:hypothetical protein
MADTAWLRAKILNRYYDKVGNVAAGAGACPVITTFGVGYGLVDESGDTPVLAAIPPDLAAVPAEFHVGAPVVAYSNGNLVSQCIVPQGSVGSPVKGNVVGLYDQAGDLVAVCTTYPDWITPDEDFRVNITMSFPVEEVS